jgi:hypothetical protein
LKKKKDENSFKYANYSNWWDRVGWKKNISDEKNGRKKQVYTVCIAWKSRENLNMDFSKVVSVNIH